MTFLSRGVVRRRLIAPRARYIIQQMKIRPCGVYILYIYYISPMKLRDRGSGGGGVRLGRVAAAPFPFSAVGTKGDVRASLVGNERCADNGDPAS